LQWTETKLKFYVQFDQSVNIEHKYILCDISGMTEWNCRLSSVLRTIQDINCHSKAVVSVTF